jgi:hypothetical protein
MRRELMDEHQPPMLRWLTPLVWNALAGGDSCHGLGV